MQDYRKLKVWEKAHQLTLKIYELTKSFPKNETYGLTSQLRRATVSIPANIAEGCGKFSDADTCRFFQISLGSVHETDYYILLSKDLLYITNEVHEYLNGLISEIKAMLISLIRKSREKSL